MMDRQGLCGSFSVSSHTRLHNLSIYSFLYVEYTQEFNIPGMVMHAYKFSRGRGITVSSRIA